MVADELTKSCTSLTVEGVSLNIATMHRSGGRTPVVFLHGFGSTKEDYADCACGSELDEHAFFAYDAPGCGESDCSDLSRLSIPFLVASATALLDAQKINQFHLVGHSMGGLTALLLARSLTGRVRSFVNIEGNLAPEDCFLSRQIVTHLSEGPHDFLDAFAERAWLSSTHGSKLFAASVRHKVRPEAVSGIFKSMVDISDGNDLLATFATLSMPRLFVYGDENRSLSSLPYLQKSGIELCEIPNSGHWPMYSNPVALWGRVGAFLRLSH